MAKYIKSQSSTQKTATTETLKIEDRAIKFSEIHPSEDSKKAVSTYFKISIINFIPVGISIILLIILLSISAISKTSISTVGVFTFVGFMIAIPVIGIPLNLIISRNSYGKIWYDYLDWYANEIEAYLASPDFGAIVANKYFKEVEYKSDELNHSTKKRYDSEIIKIALGIIFLIIGLVLYIYLMFKTNISFIILTLVMIVFAAICIFLVGDASLELRKIKTFGNNA